MNDRDRLEQLRVLRARLERMPASAGRDWMLGEVRARAVDVETGVKPAAMRSLPGDDAEAEIPAAPEASRRGAVETVPSPRPRRRPTPRRPAASARRATAATQPLPATTRQRAAHDSVIDLLAQDGVLCLDDQPAAGDRTSRTWSVGLRG